MIDFVDLQYAQMMSGRLENFRIRSTNPYKINFRCPVCGDSQKSRSKSRGWLLERDNSLFYYCHNCGISQSFQYFLKSIDNLAYNDYVAEKFLKKDVKPSLSDSKFQTQQPTFVSHNEQLKKIKKVSQLSWDHPVKKYIEKRMIPTHQHYRLYYANKFKSWINSIIPDKFANVEKDEPRLVIPFLDKEGNMFGLSARAFDPNSVRYITIMLNDKPKLFGLDTVDFKKRYFVVEGAIDSMFLKNSVAMAGADGNIRGFENLENAVFVFDSEPRNKEIHKRMERIIQQGYSVCIWPNDVPGKDINEMFLNGLKNVQHVIEQNIYKGLAAELKLIEWKKA